MLGDRTATGPDGSGGPAVTVTGIDHVVLVVRDVEVSVAWYRDLLGASVERLEEWRRSEVPFPSVRLDRSTIIDLVAGGPDAVEPAPGALTMDHLALTVESADLGAVAASGRFDVVGGPSELSGARGQGTGLYVRDPDGHRIELRTYP